MAQSDGFPSNIAQKKEQYHNRHKERIRASMKHDNNSDYDNDRKSLGFRRHCRSARISQLIDKLIKKEYYFDNQLTVSVTEKNAKHLLVPAS